jgi:hypothetical protein
MDDIPAYLLLASSFLHGHLLKASSSSSYGKQPHRLAKQQNPHYWDWQGNTEVAGRNHACAATNIEDSGCFVAAVGFWYCGACHTFFLDR